MPSVQRRIGGPSSRPLGDSAEVIRAEIFSAERLEQHAESLAAAQRVAVRPIAVRPLIARLRDNRRALLDAHRVIARAMAQGGAITPAAEWLVDNYHVVEAQIRQIGDDLPPGYYQQLPKLAEGPLAGYPRVLGMAWAFVAHTDSRFDAHLLSRFVGAYQRVQPLTIGELWAVAITLRIVLVENLRRAADLIASRRAVRQQADRLADRLLGVGGRGAELFSILNPINRALTRDATRRYKVEPYVVAADVYSEPPHVGRGGWTWYTGSAAWMYRAGLEWMLGCRLRGAMLLLDPCIPRTWPGFQITLRFGGTRYEIAVENPRGVNRRIVGLHLDGEMLPAGQGQVSLVDDGATHRVRAVLG